MLLANHKKIVIKYSRAFKKPILLPGKAFLLFLDTYYEKHESYSKVVTNCCIFVYFVMFLQYLTIQISCKSNPKKNITNHQNLSLR